MRIEDAVFARRRGKDWIVIEWNPNSGVWEVSHPMSYLEARLRVRRRREELMKTGEYKTWRVNASPENPELKSKLYIPLLELYELCNSSHYGSIYLFGKIVLAINDNFVMIVKTRDTLSEKKIDIPAYAAETVVDYWRKLRNLKGSDFADYKIVGNRIILEYGDLRTEGIMENSFSIEEAKRMLKIVEEPSEFPNKNCLNLDIENLALAYRIARRISGYDRIPVRVVGGKNFTLRVEFDTTNSNNQIEKIWGISRIPGLPVWEPANLNVDDLFKGGAK